MEIIMTRFSTLIGTAALALAIGAGAAMAQTPGPAPAAKAEKGQFKLKTPTTAAGRECSSQAEAKGLHGAERKKFRSKCKKDLKAKGKA